MFFYYICEKHKDIMIFKGFKEKSIKKHLRFLLNTSEGTTRAQLIRRVGIIVNANEILDLEVFKPLLSSLHLAPANLKIISYTEAKKTELELDKGCFHPSDIGWKGAILNTDLDEFLNTKFDLLISYYTTDLLHLKLLTAKSKAHFKASIFQDDTRLNDLIIATPLKDFNAFKAELLKYLHVFKTLQHEA